MNRSEEKRWQLNQKSNKLDKNTQWFAYKSEISPRKHVEKPTDFQMFVWLELLVVYGGLYKPIRMASVQANLTDEIANAVNLIFAWALLI